MKLRIIRATLTQNTADVELDFLIDETQRLGLSMDYHDRKRGALPWALTEVQISQDRRQARPGTENDKEDAIKADINIDYNKKMDTINLSILF